MTTRLPRRLAALITAIAVTATALVVGLGAVPAEAKPPVKPGPVTGLAMTLTKPADNFTVSATLERRHQRDDVRGVAHQRSERDRSGG